MLKNSDLTSRCPVFGQDAQGELYVLAMKGEFSLPVPDSFEPVAITPYVCRNSL